ncbi:EAL domain-containing protein [Thermaerobacillus caldiproteolyticus]|uniref:EAL domain-containing protein n=1 Tax=Thermaerobacillus caldiproteolyticus TaxID=247480 RepID=UPI0018F142DC|nr:EAL domain-containing protein [Anoxybacillus caldiproteolyticus]
MKAYRLVCNDAHELTHFIEHHYLSQYDHIFVQLSISMAPPFYIHDVLQQLHKKLPQATIIGLATDERADSHREWMISFTVFERTTCQSLVLNEEEFDNGYELGKYIAETLVTEETKLLLLFAQHLHDLPSVMSGVQSVSEKTVIIGGGIHEGETLFSEQGIVTRGVIAVGFNSSYLRVHTYSSFPWKEVGISFSVTKCNGDRLYELDGKRALTVLERYLGKEFMERIPHSAMEFPFIIKRHGYKECLQVINVYEDGSIQVNRHLHGGEHIQFSYVHIKEVLERITHDLRKISKQPTESIFLYSGTVAEGYLSPLMKQAVQAMEQIAPTFTLFPFQEIAVKYGRANTSSTAFALFTLSEGKRTEKNPIVPIHFHIPTVFQGLITLADLMDSSSRDVERLHLSVEMAKQRYQSLFEHNTDIVYSTDLHGNFTSVNPAFETILGYTKDEILYTNLLKYIHPKDVRRVSMHFYRALRGKVQYYNLEIPTKSGETLLFQIKNVPIIVNGEKIGVYSIGRDITEQKRAEEKIAYLAYYDIDTNLPNRVKFMEFIDDHIERAKRKKQPIAVLFIDMDRFKMINDSIGHYAGDEILKQLAQRIQTVLPTGAYLGRFHGDKFSMLLTKQAEPEKVVETARRILQAIAKPIVYENKELFITASIGISLYPTNGVDKHSLLKNADAAVNRAKQGGGNRIEFYSTEMNEQTLYRLELEGYLRKALEKREFFLCYQPLVDVQTGTIIGNEALLRWRHPKLGLVKPDEFIPLAEETGIIHEVGRWVLVTACKQTKQWQQFGLHPLTISVNVSASQFQQPDFVDDVKRALSQSGLEPHYLNLELTESSMLRNVHYSTQVMKELQQLGVGISIDDFGTGYSSFSYLKNLPINVLKIDRSFIEQLHKNASDIAIVKAIVTMGYGLGIKIVAEGVETEEQVELLKALRCHYAQGYVFYQPVTAEEFTKYIAVSH